MNHKIEMTREQKQFVAESILNGSKFDKYLLSLGVIHPVDEFLLLETLEGKTYLPNSDIEIDLSRVETRIRIAMPRLDWEMCQ
jgi:hypothetical protein